MLFKPVLRHYLRISALLAALLICMLSLPNVHGQERKKLKITVKLVDHEEKPVVDAQVVIRRDGELNQQGEPLKPIEGKTDSKGVFAGFSPRPGYSFFQLFEGREHKVIATPAGYSLPIERILTNQELSDAAAKGGVLNVTMSLPPPTKKTKVFVSGTVTDEQDKAVQDAQVSLAGEAKSGDEFLNQTAKAATNKEGKFEISTEVRLEGKPHQLIVNASGFTPAQWEIKDDDLLRQAGNAVVPFKLRKAGEGGYPILGYLAVLVLGAAFGFGGPTLYRRLWPKPKTTHQSSSGVALRNIAADVDEIRNTMLTKIAFQQEIKSAVEKVWVELGSPSTYILKTDSADGAGQSGIRPVEPSGRFDDSGYENQVNQFKGRNSVSRDPETIALTAYRNLINKIPLTCEPLYLDVEVPRSAAGKFEDSNVYLSQVSSSRGALVLFGDGANAGWVFPNPKVALRMAAINDVFPNLTELDYELSKENIGPKPVKKLEEGRWLVIRKKGQPGLGTFREISDI